MKRHTIYVVGMLVFMFAMGSMASGAYQWGEGQANVNTATRDELVWFLGRGQVSNPDQIADDIIAYRDSNGPFATVEELQNVKGVDDRTFEQLKLWLKVEGKTDYDPEKTVRPHPDSPFPHDGAEQR